MTRSQLKNNIREILAEKKKKKKKDKPGSKLKNAAKAAAVTTGVAGTGHYLHKAIKAAGEKNQETDPVPTAGDWFDGLMRKIFSWQKNTDMYKDQKTYDGTNPDNKYPDTKYTGTNPDNKYPKNEGKKNTRDFWIFKTM